MAEPLPQCYLNGEYLALREARISPLDRGFLFGDSVYEVVPVFAGRMFLFQEHLERLARSLREIRIENPHHNQGWLAIVEELIARNGGGDMYVYVQVSRGMEYGRNHAFPAVVKPSVFAMASPLPVFTEEQRKTGLSAITVEDFRWGRCDIKSTALLANVLMKQQAADAGANEAIIVRDGEVLEGSSTSVFVVKGGVVATPPNDHRILPGTTRDAAVAIAKERAKVAIRRITLDELRNACNGHFDVGGLFEGFARYELDAERGSGVIWADKSPAYIRHIPLILRHFPGARILHIVRDVRDHCVSMRNAWGKDLRRSAWRWGRDVLAAHRQCTSMPEHCFELKFEQLLQDPELQMRRICLFLDLEFSSGLTELAQSVEGRGDAAGRTDIVRDNFRKFESRLTPKEIAAIESLAWRGMQELGYEPLHAASPAQLSPMMQHLLKLKDAAHLVGGGIHRRGIAAAFRFHTAHRRMAG